MQSKYGLMAFPLLALFLFCGTGPFQQDLPLDRINLPDGYQIDIYYEGVDNARQMALSPSGTLFIGSRKAGNVYALVDEDKDFKADKMYTLATGLKQPNGVAFRDGDLYVAEIGRVFRYDNIEAQLDNPPKPTVINDEYPTKSHHGAKYIDFGPDGKLYLPVGAPCNICESEDEIFNSITRINPDGSGLEIVHRGVRNTVGFTWHPQTNELWFTDNGRDWMGDNLPACELNRAEKDHLHFGYPYCHQGDLPDPEFGEKRPCSDFTPPAQKLGAHVAPLGLNFVNDKQFDQSMKDKLLIAEHGSWNRSVPDGYRISMVTVRNGESGEYDVFADGWLKENGKAWGRPVDLEWMPDGSLLVSDDLGDAIYRISYSGKG